MARKPDANGTKRAREKLAGLVPPTPLVPLDLGGVRVWCKCESAQPIGAFKLRGAWHRLTDLAESGESRAVVAFSSGNHAQGVAWAAQRLGIKATIVMPADAPRLKVDGTRALGADVIFYDRLTEDRAEIAARLAQESGAVVVPSFDDPWIIEGQGSAGIEAVEQFSAMGLNPPDLVVAPCGGGGLASGLALAIPDAGIAVAEPEGWDDMRQSLEKGEIVPVGPNPPPTRCDALQTLIVSPLTFAILRERNAVAVAVTEDEVASAVRHAWQTLSVRLEPGGAVALAALLSGKIKPRDQTLVMLSGGNVDPAVFEALIA
jgi:threonine dehydratase